MNRNYSGDPNAFKAAWVRVHGFFAGVLNVQFAFGVYNDSVPATADSGLTSYYPGGNFVNLVRVDGFNFGGQTWTQVFSAALYPLKGIPRSSSRLLPNVGVLVGRMLRRSF
jgi:hypothetical protein